MSHTNPQRTVKWSDGNAGAMRAIYRVTGLPMAPNGGWVEWLP